MEERRKATSIKHTLLLTVIWNPVEGSGEQRKKPLIFKDRVSLVRLEGISDLNGQSSPATKLQFRREERPREPTLEQDVDDGVFDLNDTELLLLVQTENRKLKKEVVPDEEEGEGSMNVKDQVKTHSEQPLYVSKTGKIRESVTRIGAYGGDKLVERPSILDRMTVSEINKGRASITPVGYQVNGSGDGIPLWPIKKPPTYEEEDAIDDDRGGFFCGICTSRRNPKAATNPPEKIYRLSK